MRKLIGLMLLTTAILLVAGTLIGITPVQAAGSGVHARLSSVLENHGLGSQVQISAVVIDLDNDKVIFSHNGERALIPASNQKVLVTAAALDNLGLDFTLDTDLRARGNLKDGVLDGDLVLIGRGDPNISGRDHDGDITWVLKHLVSGLHELGITRVTGKLYFDDSYFSGERIHKDWPTDQSLRWYEAEISALTLNDNCITVQVAPGAAGSAASVSLLPDTKYVSIDKNETQTINSRSDPKIGWTRPSDENRLRVWGTISNSRGVYQSDCTVSDPAQFCAFVMLETLAAQGIAIEGGLQRAHREMQNWDDFALIKRNSSDLAATLYICNEHSQNLYAENLFRIIGREGMGEGTFAAGEAAVLHFLEQNDIPHTGLTMSDGSGLADSNRVSANTLARVLSTIAKHDDYAVYRSTLPVAGHTGTLRRRMRGGDASHANVHAKTGTINGVSALSGYVNARSGKRYAFSIIVNNYRSSAVRVIDDFVQKLAAK